MDDSVVVTVVPPDVGSVLDSDAAVLDSVGAVGAVVEFVIVAVDSVPALLVV